MNYFQSIRQKLDPRIYDGIDNVEGQQYANKSKELFFRDGKRRIDYVIAYKNPKNGDSAMLEKRMQFFSILSSKSINIEVESSTGVIHGFSQMSNDGGPLINDVYKPIFESLPEHRQSTLSENENVGFTPLEAQTPLNNAKFIENQAGNEEELYFAKLYVPWEVMKKYAEVMKLRKPIKKDKCNTVLMMQMEAFSKLPEYKRDPFRLFALSEEEVKPITFPFTIPFQASKEYLFNINASDKDSFFTQSERSLVIDYILRKLSSISNDDLNENSSSPSIPEMEEGAQAAATFLFEDIGIMKMINDKVFLAAYPLHEPNLKRKVDNLMNVKIMLQKYWASYRRVFRDQPLDYVRLYFGESIAFYFAWMSFYTKALVPIAIIGLIVFISSYFVVMKDDYLKDVCEDNGNILMCPLCKDGCNFWRMKDSCSKTRFSRMLDNGGTVFFALVVALWSTLFLEFWKRYQYRLAYQWNVHELEAIQEAPRPEFIALIDTGKFEIQKNPISNMKEPKVTLKYKIPITILGYVTTFFAVLVCVGFLLAVNAYKSSVSKALYRSDIKFFNNSANLITNITGAILNLLSILLLNNVYSRVSMWLNDKEAHRTQTQYEDALVFKMFCLQFVNYFISFFYLAFIKGTTAALPGEDAFILQSTPCDMNDCLYDLFIQLLIVFTGKQAMNFFTESIMPIMYKGFRKFKLKTFKEAHHCEDEEILNSTSDIGFKLDPHLANLSDEKKRWQATLKICRNDLALGDPGNSPLFSEFLEMMLQFGFITLFVAAFPLAPIFALINNMFELRQDAKKFLNVLRRTVAVRSKNIGIWYTILDVISKLSVRTNAFIIAITSQFIQRLVYEQVYRGEGKTGLDGYLEFSLSYMEVSRFDSSSKSNETFCRYLDYRTPPDDPNGPYKLTIVWWHIFAAKFIFVLVFENLILLATAVISELISDKPEDLRIKMMIEEQMLNNIILHVNEHKYSHPSVKRKLQSKSAGDEGHVDDDSGDGQLAAASNALDIDQEPGFYLYENGQAKKLNSYMSPVMYAEDIMNAETMNNILESGVPIVSSVVPNYDNDDDA